jgi:hypothetical protein
MDALIRSFVACSACALLLPVFASFGAQSGTPAPQSKPPAPAPQSTPPAPAQPAPAPTSGTEKPAAQSTETKPAQPAGPADARGATQGADGKEKGGATFTNEQIEQMVAPIALYPDGLLVQIMMAATYPLEVVEAQRWVEKNPKLTGKALEDALVKLTWDPSVKSMCGFPDLIKRMSTNLDWLQDLGDAFLGQKKELLDACQKLRKIAYDAGNLKTTEQQKVVVETDKTIVIQSANPEVIYVPTYSPTVVYAGWSYPTYYYPPMYPAYPPGYGAMAFTAGVFWGAAIYGGCNWGHGDVNINVDRQNNFNHVEHNVNRGDRGQGNRNQSWQHNPEHRQGVNYRDSKTAQQFGGQAGSSRVSRDSARGYQNSGAGRGGAPSASQRPAGGASGAQRPAGGGASAAQRPAGGGASASQRPASGGAGASASTRPSAGGASSPRAGSSGGALSGAGSAGADRAASTRGAASRGTSSMGGGARSGGARGGGGGRGGGGRR